MTLAAPRLPRRTWHLIIFVLDRFPRLCSEHINQFEDAAGLRNKPVGNQRQFFPSHVAPAACQTMQFLVLSKNEEKKKKLHVERSSYIWKLYYEKFFFYSKCSMIFMEQKFTRGFSYDSDKQSFTATF